MNECIDNRWRIVTMALTLLLVLGVSALAVSLTSELSLGLAVLGGSASLFSVLASCGPAAGKYFSGAFRPEAP